MQPQRLNNSEDRQERGIYRTRNIWCPYRVVFFPEGSDKRPYSTDYDVDDRNDQEENIV